MQISTADDLRARLDGVATITDAGLDILDERRLRDELIDELVFESVFNPDAALRDAARWVIWSASQALGCGSASIHELYRARGRGEFDPTEFTVPAINVRAVTYLTARQAFAAALERDAATVIFEIAKSEMAYTEQRPAEYTAVVLGAAIREG
ncbi:MAG: class II fructose-bisphosphate aldolase, partial [Candidatus Limnocylindria bacterium]